MFKLFSKKNSSSLDPTLSSQPAKKNYQNYVDPTGEFSSKKLKYSLWFVENKVLFYRVFLIFLVVFIIITWGVSLWWWGRYLLFGLSENSRLYKSLTQFNDFTTTNSLYNPSAISIVNTYVVPGGIESYDSVAEVVNSNNRFLARFDYSFLVNGQKTPKQQGVLLPGENRLLIDFGIKGSAPSTPELFLENIIWERISNQTIPNTVAWQQDHLSFIVKDFEFVRTESTEGAGAHIIKFKLTNATPYSYANATFYVGLYFQDGLVGVFPLAVNNFKSLETRAVDLRSFVANLQANEVRVFPLINIYDKEVYLKPER